MSARTPAKPRIVFFGTGPVSLQCLEGIYDAFEIEAVITKPDRRKPNGQLHEHPVRQWAESFSIPVYQVADAASLERLFAGETGQNLTSQAGLVVDFGVIIPPVVIRHFPLGIINSHFSLLPKLRGADPITFAILEGLKKTGVSLMSIVAKLDEGPLIAQQSYAVPPETTTPALTRELGDLSNVLLREQLPKYLAGGITLQPQDPKLHPSYTRKLTKQDGVIDWKRPATELERQVRAFLGWPGSRCQLFGREVTLTAVRVASRSELAPALPSDISTAELQAGAPVRSWPDRLFVIAGQDALEILSLKPAGKREMSAADFLRGLPRN